MIIVLYYCIIVPYETLAQTNVIDAEERLTIKPRHSDGFDQHSEQDRRSCCIVVQQREHVDPALQEEREGGHI